MIRVAIVGANELRWRAIAARLRGVVIDTAPAHLSLPACDAVVVCGTDLGLLLPAGKPVLMSIDGATFDNTNALTTVANPDRYLPSRQLIRQQLDAGKLGEPGLMRVHRWSASNHRAHLRDLDIVLWYFSQAPNRVYAVEHVGIHVHLGFAGGGMALLDYHPLPGKDGYYYLSLIGSSGAAYVDDHQNMQIVYSGGVPRAVRTEEGVLPWTLLLQEYADRLRAMPTTEPEPYPAWQQVLTVYEAVQQSLRTREAVELKGAP